jgi:hypothetical protein
MSPVTGALQDKLGDEAAEQLGTLLDDTRRGAAEDVMNQVGDRFERRLVDETSKLRVEMSQMRTELRLEMGQMRADLRLEIADLRTEMREGFASVRADMARDRFELLKWAFAFWVGQLFAVAGLVLALTASVRR